LYASKSASADKTQVKEIMSKEVIIGKAGDDLSYAINVMKEKRIRHLPIMDGRNLIGMISMRDLLGVELEESRTEVQLLNDYMFGANR
jgi:CBS domain-containing protein